MVLYRLNGTQPAQRLCRDMDRVFNQVFEGAADSICGGTFTRRAFPTLNAWEDDRTFIVEAEVPGLKMDDIEVLVQGDELTVKGERKASEEEGVTRHLQERKAGEFKRTLQLPVEIDAEKVEASLRDGVLTIKLPKSQAVLPRKIAVTGE